MPTLASMGMEGLHDQSVPASAEEEMCYRPTRWTDAGVLTALYIGNATPLVAHVRS